MGTKVFLGYTDSFKDRAFNIGLRASHFKPGTTQPRFKEEGIRNSHLLSASWMPGAAPAACCSCTVSWDPHNGTERQGLCPSFPEPNPGVKVTLRPQSRPLEGQCGMKGRSLPWQVKLSKSDPAPGQGGPSEWKRKDTWDPSWWLQADVGGRDHGGQPQCTSPPF